MKKLINFFQRVAKTKELKRKLLFTAGIFLVYRFLAHIPIPSVDIVQLRMLFGESQFLNLLNVFSGGTLANFSIMALGINPYITSAIIMQLAGIVIPKIKEMQREGESGKEKVNQYTRLLTVPLALGQSVSVLALLRSQGLLMVTGPLPLIAMIVSLVAGALILMWLGELISIHGIGNGISIVLFGAIISQLPSSLSQALATTGADQALTNVSFLVVFLLIIGLVVFMNEAVRKITIQYAKRVRGSRVYGGQLTHLPIKVNVSGVMPIIFGVSLMLVPSFLARLMLVTDNPRLVELGQWLTINFQETSTLYIAVYFALVFFFAFFSALIFFDAKNISNELKKSGAFVPGVRPGAATKKYLEFVVTRITLVGAIFLGSIAIMPSIAQILTGVQALAVGGTSLLIVVSVVLETTKQAESLMVDQDYEKFI